MNEHLNMTGISKEIFDSLGDMLVNVSNEMKDTTTPDIKSNDWRHGWKTGFSDAMMRFDEEYKKIINKDSKERES